MRTIDADTFRRLRPEHQHEPWRSEYNKLAVKHGGSFPGKSPCLDAIA